MSKLKIAFCGLGNAANFYYEILKDHQEKDNIELIAGFDKSSEQASLWENKTLIPSYNSLSSIKDLEADFVIITSPSGSHANDARFFLDEGINVLCEKPIGLSLEEVKNNIDIALKNHIQYGGVFQNRFNEPIKYIKDKIDNGAFGRVISSSVKLQWSRPQSYYEDGWHGTWLHDGGVINQQAIHHIDALFYLLGKPSSLAGFGGNIINKLEAEDTFVGAGVIDNNGFFTLEASTALRPKDLKASIEIIGTKAQAGIGGPAINTLDYFIQNGQSISQKELDLASEEVTSGFGNGHSKMINEIINEWKQNKKIIFPISAQDSLLAVQAVHAFYRSWEDKSIIEFDDQLSSLNLGK